MRKRASLIAAGATVAALAALTGWLWYWYGYGARAASLAESDDPNVRLEIVQLLRGRSDSLALQILGRLTQDKHARVAREAVRAVAANLSEDNHRLLADLLNRPGAAPVRGEAAAALGKYDATDVKLLVEILRNDPDELVRAGAARGLGRKRGRATLGDLVAALDDDSQAVRIAAISAVHKITIVQFNFDAGAGRAERRSRIATIRSILKRRGMLK